MTRAIEIMGVRVDAYTRHTVKSLVHGWLSATGAPRVIVTPNPEFLVAAHKDREFREILNRSDLALPDGFGILLAAYFKGVRLKRITGVDFITDVAEIAAREGKSVFFLGGRNGAGEKAARRLAKRFVKLRIAGTFEGKGDPTGDQETVEKICYAKPDILLVAYGAPKQEKWIARNLPQLDGVKIAMGVGGAFDFISGHVRRAPWVLRALGLEWCWRLAIEPWRIRRIYTATIVFSFLFIRKLIHVRMRKERERGV